MITLDELLHTLRLLLFIAALPLILWLIVHKVSRALSASSDALIFKEVCDRALAETSRMNAINVPVNDPRRILPVTLRERKVCAKRGIVRLYGLELSVAE